MCELVLQGETIDVKHPQQVLYPVVPAHLVVEEEDRKEMMRAKNPVDITTMRDKSESRASYKRYSFSQHADSSSSDLEYNTMFVYKHYTQPQNSQPATTGRPEKQSDEQSNATFTEFTKDLAIIKIPQHEFHGAHSQRPAVSRQTICDAMKKKYRSHLIKGKVIDNHVDIDQIFPLQLVSTLEKMGRLGVRVMMGNDSITGYMIPCGDAIASHDRRWTCSIQFVSDNQ